jgi:hypothetical protein
MSLLDVYARNAGVLPVDKPNLNIQYFPVPYEKYITLHAGDGRIQSKHYDYWSEVVGLIKPAFHHFGIRIIQVGGPQDQVVQGVDASYLTLSYAQSAYVQKGAILHAGIDSLGIHNASAFGKKIVALYSHIYKNQSPCNWSAPEDVIYLEPDRGTNHPPFGPVEYPKMVNTIKVETIARSIFSLLNLPVDIKFQTQFIGEHYNLPIVEVIPDFFGESAELNGANINLRLDLNFDENCAHAWAQRYAVKLITKQPINLQLLSANKKNIAQLTLLFDDKDSFTLEYVKEAKKLIPNLVLVGMKEENLSDTREKFFDWIVERMPVPDRNKVERLPKDCKFWTKKSVFSKTQRYASIAHWKMQKPFDGQDFVINSEEFAQDIEHFFIYN